MKDLLQTAGAFCKPAIFMLITPFGASRLHHICPAGFSSLMCLSRHSKLPAEVQPI